MNSRRDERDNKTPLAAFLKRTFRHWIQLINGMEFDTNINEPGQKS